MIHELLFAIIPHNAFELDTRDLDISISSENMLFSKGLLPSTIDANVITSKGCITQIQAIQKLCNLYFTLHYFIELVTILTHFSIAPTAY